MDFQKSFQYISAGIVIYSLESDDCYASPSALELLNLKESSKEVLNKRLEAVSGVSVEDIKNILNQNNRDFVSFLSTPLEELSQTGSRTSPLILFYFPGRSKDNAKDIE